MLTTRDVVLKERLDIVIGLLQSIKENNIDGVYLEYNTHVDDLQRFNINIRVEGFGKFIIVEGD